MNFILVENKNPLLQFLLSWKLKHIFKIFLSIIQKTIDYVNEKQLNSNIIKNGLHFGWRAFAFTGKLQKKFNFGY